MNHHRSLLLYHNHAVHCNLAPPQYCDTRIEIVARKEQVCSTPNTLCQYLRLVSRYDSISTTIRLENGDLHASFYTQFQRFATTDVKSTRSFSRTGVNVNQQTEVLSLHLCFPSRHTSHRIISSAVNDREGSRIQCCRNERYSEDINFRRTL